MKKSILEQKWVISSSTIILTLETMQIVTKVAPLMMFGGLDITIDEAVKVAEHIVNKHNESL